MAARNVITTRISLVGGTELETLLKRLGTSGAEAFKNIQAAADKVKGPGPQLEQRLKSIQTTLRSTGQQITAFGKSVRQIGQSASLIGAAVGGAVAGIVLLAKSGGDAADAMDRQAQAAGLTIEEYAKLQFAAEQAEVSSEQFGTAMSRLNRTINDAASGNAAAAQKFDKLGVSIEMGGKIRPTIDIVTDLAAAFNRMPDGAQKSARAIELFGRAGANLIPFLNTTKEELEALFAEVERLGLGFTKEQAELGDNLGDTLALMGRAIKALKDQIGLVFAPSIIAVAEAITDFIAENREAIIGFVQDIVDGFNALPGPIKAVIGGLVGFAIAIGPVLIAIGLFVQVIGFAIGGLGTLVGGIGFFIGALAKIPLGVSGAVRAISFMLGLLGGPWGIAIGVAIAAVVFLVVQIVKNWDAIKAAFQEGIANVSEAFSDFGSFLLRVWDQTFGELWRIAKDVFDDVVGWLRRIIADAARGAQAVANVAKKAAGMRGGGLVSGPGTGTSDSIPARLSAGEYVIRAAAVRKYGTSLFANLNQMRLAAKDLRFGMGGLVASMTRSMVEPMRFAEGGFVPARADGGRSFTLVLDGKTFTGLRAPQDTAEDLVKFARSRQVRSAGRKPDWYGS